MPLNMSFWELQVGRVAAPALGSGLRALVDHCERRMVDLDGPLGQSCRAVTVLFRRGACPPFWFLPGLGKGTAGQGFVAPWAGSRAWRHHLASYFLRECVCGEAALGVKT